MLMEAMRKRNEADTEVPMIPPIAPTPATSSAVRFSLVVPGRYCRLSFVITAVNDFEERTGLTIKLVIDIHTDRKGYVDSDNDC